MTQKIAALAAWVAEAFHVGVAEALAAIDLLERGKKVPFVAGFQQALTGGLNAESLYLINERLRQGHELQSRCLEIIALIQAQGCLTDELHQQLLQAESRACLEDLFLPFREKRGLNKASIALSAGLLPLAQALLLDPSADPHHLAQSYVAPDAGVPDSAAALQGAREILIQQWCENAALLQQLREYGWQHAVLESRALPSKKSEHALYVEYADYTQPLSLISARDAWMLFRGRREHALQLKVLVTNKAHEAETLVARAVEIPADGWLMDAVRIAWKTKLNPMLSSELLARLRTSADEEAIQGYRRELRHVLMKPPAGPCVTMGLYITARMGVNAVVLDAQGQYLDGTTVFIWGTPGEREEALIALAKLAAKHAVCAISIGQGSTSSREVSRLVMKLMQRYPDMPLTYVLVHDVGAMAYGESALAQHELPHVTALSRAAVSIARRLQDPLAALVEIEPKALVMGAALHDVNSALLTRRLHDVVELCVNEVGVDVNTASPTLLRYVCGLNDVMAKKIVSMRDAQGPFHSHAALQELLGVDDDAFAQIAAFLRVSDAKKSADSVGDSRGIFRLPVFNKKLSTLRDLHRGMVLDGTVSAINQFGVFVDIGLSHHGLVHSSLLSQQPQTVFNLGDGVTVRVMHVDRTRQRISLGLKGNEARVEALHKRVKPEVALRNPVRSEKKPTPQKTPQPKAAVSKNPFNTAMADALLKLKRTTE